MFQILNNHIFKTNCSNHQIIVDLYFFHDNKVLTIFVILLFLFYKHYDARFSTITPQQRIIINRISRLHVYSTFSFFFCAIIQFVERKIFGKTNFTPPPLWRTVLYNLLVDLEFRPLIYCNRRNAKSTTLRRRR